MFRTHLPERRLLCLKNQNLRVKEKNHLSRHQGLMWYWIKALNSLWNDPHQVNLLSIFICENLIISSAYGVLPHSTSKWISALGDHESNIEQLKIKFWLGFWPKIGRIFGFRSFPVLLRLPRIYFFSSEKLTQFLKYYKNSMRKLGI